MINVSHLKTVVIILVIVIILFPITCWGPRQVMPNLFTPNWNTWKKHGATAEQGGVVRMRGASLWPLSPCCLSGLQGPIPAVNPRIAVSGKDISSRLKLFVRLHCPTVDINCKTGTDRPGRRLAKAAEHPFLLSLTTEVFQCS